MNIFKSISTWWANRGTVTCTHCQKKFLKGQIRKICEKCLRADFENDMSFNLAAVKHQEGKSKRLILEALKDPEIRGEIKKLIDSDPAS